MNNSKGIGSIIVKIFVVVFGIAALIVGVKYLGVNAADLKSVDAEVVSVSEELADDSGTSSYTVTYTYTVDGIGYQSNYSSYSDVQQGEKITVYYDPASPAESYQSQGESTYVGIMGILLGLACLGGMGWEAIKSIRNKSKESATPPAIQNVE